MYLFVFVFVRDVCVLERFFFEWMVVASGAIWLCFVKGEDWFCWVFILEYPCIEIFDWSGKPNVVKLVIIVFIGLDLVGVVFVNVKGVEYLLLLVLMCSYNLLVEAVGCCLFFFVFIVWDFWVWFIFLGLYWNFFVILWSAGLVVPSVFLLFALVIILWLVNYFDRCISVLGHFCPLFYYIMIW